jgi:flavin reductase (DIM6/NTAB) family NADH-FMN oxidoreductase RutF
MTFHSYTPTAGHGLPHDPIRAIIAPRPIGWMSTLDSKGGRNLAPFSFFSVLSLKPCIIGFASNGDKHTYLNARDTGEFCFNLVGLPLANAMNKTALEYEPGVDEFEIAGLDWLPSDAIGAPRVAASAAAFECKVTQIVDLEGLDGPTPTHFIIGEAVRIHIRHDCLTDGLFDIVKAQTIARCGYRGDYVHVERTFEMMRADGK